MPQQYWLEQLIACIPYNMQNIFNSIVDIKAFVLKIIVKINTTTTSTTTGVRFTKL